VGNFVALCDSDEDHFHICRVLAIEDVKAILLNYSTSTRNLKLAKFGILYQKRSTQQYTLEPPGKKAREQEVIDQVPLEDAESFFDNYDESHAHIGQVNTDETRSASSCTGGNLPVTTGTCGSAREDNPQKFYHRQRSMGRGNT